MVDTFVFKKDECILYILKDFFLMHVIRVKQTSTCLVALIRLKMKELNYSKYHERAYQQSRNATSRMPYKYKEVRGPWKRKRNSERLVF